MSYVKSIIYVQWGKNASSGMLQYLTIRKIFTEERYLFYVCKLTYLFQELFLLQRKSKRRVNCKHSSSKRCMYWFCYAQYSVYLLGYVRTKESQRLERCTGSYEKVSFKNSTIQSINEKIILLHSSNASSIGKM